MFQKWPSIKTPLLVGMVCLIFLYFFPMQISVEPPPSNDNETSEEQIPPATDEVKDLVNEFERRKEDLRKGCKRFFPEQSRRVSVRDLPMELLVHERLKLLWCRVAKVAGSHWFRTLNERPTSYDNIPMSKVANGADFFGKLVERTEWNMLIDFMPKKLVAVIRTYTKVMWVRDPMVRLISAYRDRLATNKEEREKEERRRIIECCRPNATKEEIEKADSVTLEEFFTFLVRYGETKENFNIHWRPYYSTCDVCTVPFDFIGKVEHFDTESDFILSQIFQGRDLPEVPPAYSHESSASLADEMLSALPSQLVQAVAHVYEEDYELFGYPKPKATF